MEFVVPPHSPLEVLNGIQSGVVKKRLDPDQSREIGNDFIDLAIPTTDVRADYAEIFREAMTLDRSTYDAAYIVLAERSRLDLVTADRKRFEAVSARKPFVRPRAREARRLTTDCSGRSAARPAAEPRC
jgi:predicted nucleic acid-binding protein